MGKPTRRKRRVEPPRTEPRPPQPPKVEPPQGPTQKQSRLRSWSPPGSCSPPGSRPWPMSLSRPATWLDGRSPLRWLRRRRFVRWLRRRPIVRRLCRRMAPGRVRSMLAGTAIVAAAFAIGAYVVAPYLIQRAVEHYGEGSPERSASAARVQVDPFSLSVTLVRPVLVDSTLGASFGADEVRINFAFSSLLGRSIALDEVGVRAPTLRLDLEKMNTGRLKSIFGGTPISSTAGDSFGERLASVLGIRSAVRIGRVRVESGRLELVAADAEKSSTFDGLRIDAQRLATEGSGAGRTAAGGSGVDGRIRYSVSSDEVRVGSAVEGAGTAEAARAPEAPKAAEAAALDLDGTLSLALEQPHTQGHAKLSGFALRALRSWLAPRLAAASPSGRLDIEVDYEYPIASKWRLSNGEARITDASAEVAPGLFARAANAQLHLTAASGGEALEAAAFGVRAEQVTVVEAPGDGDPRRLAFANSAEASDITLSGAKSNGSGLLATGDDRDFPWLVTIGTGRLAGLAAAVEVANASAAGDSVRDLDFDGARAWLPGRALLASLARPAFSSAEAGTDRPFVLHRLELAGARVAFVDRAATPAARFEATDLAGSISASAAEPGDDVIEVSLSGDFADGGSGSFDAVLAKNAFPVPRSLALMLRDIPASKLSPYAERMLGRALGAGRVGLVFECEADDEHLDGNLRITGDALVLAGLSPPTLSSSSLSPSRPSALPVDLAVALLTDPSGGVELTSALATAAETETRTESATTGFVAACVPAVAAETLRSKLAAVVAMPFETLARAVGREASSLDAVSFEPGAAEPSEAGLDALDALAEALERRPRVGLRVAAAYDPEVDRGALAKQEVELHVALETAGATLRVTPGDVDFTLPLTQKVLDEFAARQLTAEQRATIASEFDLHATEAADAATRAAYYRALFDALVRTQTIQPGALARLGRFRAESIARQLEKRGINRERIARVAPSADEKGGGEPEGRGSTKAENGGVAVPLEVVALPFEDVGR